MPLIIFNGEYRTPAACFAVAPVRRENLQDRVIESQTTIDQEREAIEAEFTPHTGAPRKLISG